MIYNNTGLLNLQQQASRYRNLQYETAELLKRQEFLTIHMQELGQEKSKKQDAIEKLQKPGWNSFVLSITGKIHEKLDKEQQEICELDEKCDAFGKELKSIKDKLQKYEKEMKRLQGCEAELECLIKDKIESIKASAKPIADAICMLEKQIVDLTYRKELIEKVKPEIEQLQQPLNELLLKVENAEKMVVQDLASRFDVHSTATANAIHQAAEYAKLVEQQVSSINGKLEQLEDNVLIQMNIEDFYCFAVGYMQYGMNIEAELRSKVRLAKVRCKEMKKQAEQIGSSMAEMEKDINQKYLEKKEELELLVIKS